MVTVGPRRNGVHVGPDGPWRGDARLWSARLRRLAVRIPATRSVTSVFAVRLRVLRKVIWPHESFIAKRTRGKKVALRKQLMAVWRQTGQSRTRRGDRQLNPIAPQLNLRLAINLAANHRWQLCGRASLWRQAWRCTYKSWNWKESERTERGDWSSVSFEHWRNW